MNKIKGSRSFAEDIIYAGLEETEEDFSGLACDIENRDNLIKERAAKIVEDIIDCNCEKLGFCECYGYQTLRDIAKRIREI